MQRAGDGAKRPEARRWSIRDAVEAGVRAPHDDQPIGLRREPFGDMLDQRPAIEQRQRLVRAEAAGLATRQDSTDNEALACHGSILARPRDKKEGARRLLAGPLVRTVTSG